MKIRYDIEMVEMEQIHKALKALKEMKLPKEAREKRGWSKMKAAMKCRCGADQFNAEVFRMDDNGTMIQELSLTCSGCGRKVRYFAKQQWFIAAQEVA